MAEKKFRFLVVVNWGLGIGDGVVGVPVLLVRCVMSRAPDDEK